MKAIIIVTLTVLTALASAETIPIRGATGGGYGRFSWGTSLETVETLVRTLIKADSAETQTERKAIRLIRKANRRLRKTKAKAKIRPVRRRLDNYRYWIKLNKLPTRVDLGFFDQRLHQAVVGAAYSKGDLATVDDIMDVLVEKYGPPISTADRKANIDEDNELNFEMSNGQLIVQRTPPSGSKNGFIRLSYQSTELYPEVKSYLTDLRKRIVKAKSALAKKNATSGRKTPRERQIERMRSHL